MWWGVVGGGWWMVGGCVENLTHRRAEQDLTARLLRDAAIHLDLPAHLASRVAHNAAEAGGLARARRPHDGRRLTRLPLRVC